MSSGLRLRHLKGLSGQVPGCVQIHPTAPGEILYVLGNTMVQMNEGNPTAQRIYQGHVGAISSFAVANAAGLAATGERGRNADVLVWDLATGAPRFKFGEHEFEVGGLAFSADDRVLVSVGDERDAMLIFWDMQTGNVITKSALTPPVQTTALAWAPNSGGSYRLATASESSIAIWTLDPFKGQLTNRRVDHGSVRREYTNMVWSACGQWLHAGTRSGDVVTVNVGRAAVQLTHPLCSRGIGGMLRSHGGKILVAGGDGSLHMFSHEDMRHTAPPIGRVPGSVTSLAATRDGSSLVVGTIESCIFKVAAGSMACTELMQAHSGAVRGVAFSRTHPTSFATVSADRSVRVWDTTTLRQAHCSVVKDAGAGQCITVAQDVVITGWEDGNIRGHAFPGPGLPRGVAPLEQIYEIPNAHNFGKSLGVTAVTLSWGDQYILSGGAGGEVRAWDSGSREMMVHLKQHSAPITGLAVFADNQHILSSCEDMSVNLWNVKSEQRVTSFRDYGGAVTGVALMGDQMQMVTVGADTALKFWDMRDPEPKSIKPRVHRGTILCIARSHDSRLFATGGSDDRTLRLWDFQSGALLAEHQVHTGKIHSLAFSPDNRTLVTAGDDGIVALWDVLA